MIRAIISSECTVENFWDIQFSIIGAQDSSDFVDGIRFSHFHGSVALFQAMQPAFNLTNLILAVIAIIGALSSVVLYFKVYLPMMQRRAEAEVAAAIKDAASRGGLEVYEPVIGSPIWHIVNTHRTHVKSKNSRFSGEGLAEIVDEIFPSMFDEERERVLIGFCRLLKDLDHFYFLGKLTNPIRNSISDGEFNLRDASHKFMMRCFALSDVVVKIRENQPIKDDAYVQMGEVIKELEEWNDYHDEFIDFVSNLMVTCYSNSKSAAFSSSIVPMIPEMFQSVSYSFKNKFLQKLKEHNITTLLDGIVKTISLKSVLQQNKQYWERLFKDLVELGYKQRVVPFNTEGVHKISFEKRYEFANELIQSKTIRDEALKNLVSIVIDISEDERSAFYSFQVPTPVTEYCIKVGLSSFTFLSTNRRVLLDLIHRYQQHQIPGRVLLSFVRIAQFRPQGSIISKIVEEPGTRAIFRYTMGNLIADRLAEGNFDISNLLHLYGPPYDAIVDIIGANIDITILNSGSDRNLQESLLTLQSVILESGGSKEKIHEIGSWLKLWSSVNEITDGAKAEHEYISKLLGVIEETEGELEPLYIAQKQLSLIGNDLERCVRIFHNLNVSSASEFERVYKRRVEESRSRLEAIKNSYYKLQLIIKNQSLKLTAEDREAMRKIADEILAFVIKIRRRDFYDRLENFPLEFVAVLDPGALVQSALKQADFVYFPASFHPFPLPAFRVLNEFLSIPESIPYAGNRANGIIITPEYWLFASAVGLTFRPSIAFAEEIYSNFFVPEYLKTVALAYKKGVPWIEKIFTGRLLEAVDIDLGSLIVSLFKQLTDHHFFQGVITRELIVEALEFGGWDTSLADKIIEEKKYCVFCSYALPSDVDVCPNCEREVQEFDLSSMTDDDLEIDLDGFDMGVSESEASQKPGSTQQPRTEQPEASQTVDEEGV